MTRGWEITTLGPERWGGATESHSGKRYSGETSQGGSWVNFPLLQQKSLRKPTSKEQKLLLLSFRDLGPQLGDWCFGAVVRQSIKRTENVRGKSHDLEMSWKQRERERKGLSTNIPSKSRSPMTPNFLP